MRDLAYPEVRLRWCRAAVLALLRRWGIYFGAGILILGGFSNGAVSAMAAIAAWSVLPLFHAASQAGWLAALVAALHGLIGAVVLWALRPVLWSRDWSEVERALPIRPAERRRSDLVVLLIGLCPLWVLYAAGAANLSLSAALHPVLTRALTMLVVSMAVSLSAGFAMLQRMRQPPRSLRRATAPARKPGSVIRRTSTLQALSLKPLWRGPAQRLARLLLLGGTALLAPAAGLWLWGERAGWWLAGFALMSLALTTRLQSLADSDLAPLHEAALPLPLSATALRRTRQLIVWSPLPPALAVLMAALLHGPHAPRPVLLMAYAAACLAASAAQVLARGKSPETQVSRWLLSLVLMIALASEVLP